MSKYRAKPTTCDGIRFHSKKESLRYAELKLLEKAGQIKNIELQPRFRLEICNRLIATYVADFRYFDVKTGEVVVEDTKGFATREYKLKRALFEAIYGRKILET